MGTHAYKPKEFESKKLAKKDIEDYKNINPKPKNNDELLNRIEKIEKLLGV